MNNSLSAPGSGPHRRACTFCRRGEAEHTLDLASIRIDGRPARACLTCRAPFNGKVWTCGVCARTQGGQRYAVGGVGVCLECAQRAHAVP